MSDVTFHERVVIVTGAGHGLGRCHALEFGRRGAKVVVNDLGGSSSGEGFDKRIADIVADEIVAAGGQAVASYDSVADGDKIVQTALDEFGRVDVVVNNAGIIRDKSFHKMSDDDWDIIYEVHVRGAYKVTHAAWPYLREQNFGRIVFTTSASGIYGNFGQANYAMAKMGQIGLANCLALEGRSKNIFVNTIAPFAGSRLTETVLPEEITGAVKPDYVTPLVVKLCDENSEVTGGLFEVGAGFIGQLRWERAQGALFNLGEGFSAEEVNAQWESITSFVNAIHPANAQEAGAIMYENLKTTSGTAG